LNEVVKSEGDAMRKVNTTVLGLHKALEKVGKKVDGMNPGKGKGAGRKEFEAKREEKEVYDIKYKGKEGRVVEVQVKKNEKGGIVFVSNIPKMGDGEGWFSTKAEDSSLS